MNSLQSNTSVFQRLRFILVETSHPGNVGSAARAMKTMGFNELILVNPKISDVLTHQDAIAMASGANDVLESARVVSSFEEALDGVSFVAAVSARLREFSPPIFSPRQLAENHISNAEKIALVFGNERFGLPNDIVVACNALVNIPANSAYSSLNLAQAVQVLAYEFRLSLIETSELLSKTTSIGFSGKLATAHEIDGMFSHLEQALISLDFLDPTSPKKLMPRLKRLFSRTHLEVEEVNIFRGIAKKIIDRGEA
ncbi:MAG: RNA methyltransferase [Burkholderiaceae bacterium]|nr:RNA methyltransferase [Burkholderiaceae bacterium]